MPTGGPVPCPQGPAVPCVPSDVPHAYQRCWHGATTQWLFTDGSRVVTGVNPWTGQCMSRPVQQPPKPPVFFETGPGINQRIPKPPPQPRPIDQRCSLPLTPCTAEWRAGYTVGVCPDRTLLRRNRRTGTLMRGQRC